MIEHKNVKFLVREQLKRFVAVRGALRPDSAPGEHISERIHKDGFIIDEKYPNSTGHRIITPFQKTLSFPQHLSMKCLADFFFQIAQLYRFRRVVEGPKLKPIEGQIY